MSKPHTVGQTRTDGFMTYQIMAIAEKWDVADTLVILEKALDTDNLHVVYEITPNLGDRHISGEAHTNQDYDGQIMSSHEKALQDWTDRAFGVNIF
jgi:hypothetical protein